MSNVDWSDVRRHTLNQLQASQTALESCEIDQVPYYRGRIHALRSVMDLGETPTEFLDGAKTVPSFIN